MTELLPCPFCGGEADLDEIPGSPFTTETYSWGAGCKDCNIGWYNENKAEAIAAWNKRAVKLNMSVEHMNRVIDDLINEINARDLEIARIKKELDAAVDDLEDLIEYYHVCNKCAHQTATGKCELWEKYGDGTCSAKW